MTDEPSGTGRLVPIGTASTNQVYPRLAATDAAMPDQARARGAAAGRLAWMLVRAMRPTQWLKNGLVFAGLVFGGKLLDAFAVWQATLAAVCFCLVSSGFYLVNDVCDMMADRVHPAKRLRPVAAGELPAATAVIAGVFLVAVGLLASMSVGGAFAPVALGYAALMVAYNASLKQIVILDVFAIAAGFVLRAVGGAVAVTVSISPWLLLCTMLLALLIGFGKRRYELVGLEQSGLHRRSLVAYSRSMLDQSVAVAAAGTLIAYAVYTFDSESAPVDHRMMLTIPIVAYGIFRYVYLLYHRGEGGAPEAMLLSDRALLAAVALWSATSAALFYLGR